MIVCVNTYRVKPGLRNELVKEITGKNIPQKLRTLPGNLYFNFSAAVDDEDVLYLTDAWRSLSPRGVLHRKNSSPTVTTVWNKLLML